VQSQLVQTRTRFDLEAKVVHGNDSRLSAEYEDEEWGTLPPCSRCKPNRLGSRRAAISNNFEIAPRPIERYRAFDIRDRQSDVRPARRHGGTLARRERPRHRCGIRSASATRALKRTTGMVPIVTCNRNGVVMKKEDKKLESQKNAQTQEISAPAAFAIAVKSGVKGGRVLYASPA
jgi:hypothetical protein